ncbi:MAG: S41 family peptidase [Sphingobacteriales bacterium]|nr:MAG: S41 family peptidase [Sphingobacteriales bacterium]
MLLFAPIGMILGFNLRDTLRNKRDIQTLERNDRLEQIIDLVDAKYVDSLDKDVLYEDAINGILSHLDPHTVYIPANEYDEMNEALDGSFFGIGVEFSIIRDTIQVTSVIDEGPANVAGVIVGDQLIKVGDSVVAGKSITSERIIKMLKGKQYSKVYVTLLQPQDKKLKTVQIKRDIVPVYSVIANIMLDSATGYIKINKFGANTYNEFIKAFKSLKEKGMQMLVVDLRQNAGGYLNAATEIADEFLEDNKLLVYTEGKNSPRKDYKAEKRGIFEQGRLAILIDESSASASEILAGAIQDWDRGVVIGRRSYGKGLVQEQYDMDNGAGLRLTIAKYYTPSGRSIQRSFAKGREAYEEDFAKRFESGELIGNDTAHVLDTTKYYTGNKRVVYGGGGIKPDVYVPYDTAKLSNALLNIVYTDEMKNEVWDYFMKHRADLLKYKTVKAFEAEMNTEDLLMDYVNTLAPSAKNLAKKILAAPYNRNYLKLQMQAQLARILFGNNGYFSISIKDDNVVQMAKRVLHSDTYSKIIGR